MDISIANLTKIASDVGLLGLVVFFWWYDNRRIWVVFEANKADLVKQREYSKAETTAILAQYREDMVEQREMYRNNASLARDFASIATDLRDIVTLNIQTMTHLDDAIRQNEFCPMLRINRERSIKMFPKEEDNR
jgi:hypothetical protein